MKEYKGLYEHVVCPVELEVAYDTGDLVDQMIKDQFQEGEATVGIHCSVDKCAVRALVQRHRMSGVTTRSISIYQGETCTNRQ